MKILKELENQLKDELYNKNIIIEEEKKEKEEINLEIDYGGKNISIKNNCFVISKNHSIEEFFYKGDSKYSYFQDDVCCFSYKLCCRKCFKLLNKSTLLSYICFCSFCQECLEEFPENFDNYCKCDNDFCGSCQCDYYCCDSCYSDFCCDVWGKFWTYCFIIFSFPFCICCYLKNSCDRDDINEL